MDDYCEHFWFVWGVVRKKGRERNVEVEMLCGERVMIRCLGYDWGTLRHCFTGATRDLVTNCNCCNLDDGFPELCAQEVRRLKSFLTKVDREFRLGWAILTIDYNIQFSSYLERHRRYFLSSAPHYTLCSTFPLILPSYAYNLWMTSEHENAWYTS